MSEGVHFLDAAGPDAMRLYAIGDVHGRLDLLQRMHAAIEADIARYPGDDWRVIHLGDYVDRGPDSRGVLEFLIARQAMDERFIALAGNHDRGLLEFLDSPATAGLFVDCGGDATAWSYGVKADFFDRGGLARTQAALVAAIPAAHRHFLETLPFSASFGDFFFCHAGIRPGVPLDRQSNDDLIWIRTQFHNHLGLHPKVIVHGHTPVGAPEILANRVNVDTLAYDSGLLSALVVSGAEKAILSIK